MLYLNLGKKSLSMTPTPTPKKKFLQFRFRLRLRKISFLQLRLRLRRSRSRSRNRVSESEVDHYPPVNRATNLLYETFESSVQNLNRFPGEKPSLGVSIVRSLGFPQNNEASFLLENFFGYVQNSKRFRREDSFPISCRRTCIGLVDFSCSFTGLTRQEAF